MVEKSDILQNYKKSNKNNLNVCAGARAWPMDSIYSDLASYRHAEAVENPSAEPRERHPRQNKPEFSPMDLEDPDYPPLFCIGAPVPTIIRASIPSTKIPFSNTYVFPYLMHH
jgi:hypothetical protein